jgi:hypothetical protein
VMQVLNRSQNLGRRVVFEFRQGGRQPGLEFWGRLAPDGLSDLRDIARATRDAPRKMRTVS